jgi:polysaccharide export outer membrane protein
MEIDLPESVSGSAIPLLTQQNFQDQWIRPIQPESNSTFTTISGIPYYRLGPSDELELTINLEDGPNQFPLVINPDGFVQLPAILLEERVHIAGLAIPQAEERLSESLANVLRRPLLTLRVTSYQHAFVTLVGKITQQGRFPLTGRTTLLDFVLTHSSFTEDTDITAVIVTDGEGRSGVFDLSATIYSADQSHNPVLDRNDVVTVPSVAETRRYVYVLGEVTTPSLLHYRPGLTVVDAISEAGGPNQRARQKWISLVRGRGSDAELTQIPYSRILKQGDMKWNASLAPGDILYVGRSTYSTAVEFFRDTWIVLQSAVIATVLTESLRKQ